MKSKRVKSFSIVKLNRNYKFKTLRFREFSAVSKFSSSSTFSKVTSGLSKTASRVLEKLRKLENIAKRFPGSIFIVRMGII